MTYANKPDANQDAIVSALRKAGCTVQSLGKVRDGCPDLLVGRAGVNYLLEVKTARGALTEDEASWHWAWNGQVLIVRSPGQALAAVGLTGA